MVKARNYLMTHILFAVVIIIILSCQNTDGPTDPGQSSGGTVTRINEFDDGVFNHYFLIEYDGGLEVHKKKYSPEGNFLVGWISEYTPDGHIKYYIFYTPSGTSNCTEFIYSTTD